MFLPSQLAQYDLLTNITLRRDHIKDTTTGEAIKNFGILILHQIFNLINGEIWDQSNLNIDIFLPQPWERLVVLESI